jgi:hypothetical protein
MLAARLGGKIAHADLNASVRALRSHVPDLALPDHPGEVALAVPRDPGGLGEVHDAVRLRDQRNFDLGRRPIESAGGALGAEGLTELLGLGTDVRETLVETAMTGGQQKKTPLPKNAPLSVKDVVLRGGLCARRRGEVKT